MNVPRNPIGILRDPIISAFHRAQPGEEKPLLLQTSSDPVPPVPMI